MTSTSRSSQLLIVSTFFTVFLAFANVVLSSCPDWGIRQFDYYILAQTYPVTFCATTKCASGKMKNYFTIHGLWPSLTKPVQGRWWPQCCNAKDRIDFNNLRSHYANSLNAYWVDAKRSDGYTAGGLYDHEWEKHGTCSGSSQLQYFGNAIVLRDRIDLMKVLRQSGIIPDNQKLYSVGAISNAVQKGIGYRPQVSCKKLNGREFLFEIMMCTNKQLNFIDCPVNASYKCFNMIFPASSQAFVR